MSRPFGRESVGGYSTRRGYLLNKAGWGCVLIGIVYLLFLRDSYPYTVALYCGAGALACFVIARWFEKRARKSIEVDENGNAKKRIL